MATNKLSAFDLLAEGYKQHRSSYPEDILNKLAEMVATDTSIDGRRLVIDVGSGTGIAARQIACILGAGWTVIGVEPGAGMLAQSDRAELENVRFMAGRAEQLPFAQHDASLVIAAQAIQWFDRFLFYREATRVLAPNGVLAILQNNRQWKLSPFLDAYEDFLEAHSPGYCRTYREFNLASELASAGFNTVDIATANWTRRITREGFIGMAMSSTKMQAAVRHIGELHTMQLIHGLFDAHNIGESLDLPYVTELFTGRTASSLTTT